MMDPAKIDTIGFGGAALLFLLIVLGAFIISQNWVTVTEMARGRMEKMNASAGSSNEETSSPIDTTAPCQ